ncbi:hypothetical protein BG003_000250 [Podila horticola]|nr:hypothetical protein BG003_000250 [Podila horticola]
MKLFHALPLAALLVSSVFAGEEYLYKYHYARCTKNGVDWAYLQNKFCNSIGGSGHACNGPCLDVNGRYCLFKDTDDGRRGMCKFREWCQQDGYVAKSAYCADLAGFPTGCGTETIIKKSSRDSLCY